MLGKSAADRVDLATYAVRLAELMYPHIEHAAQVCVEEAEQFLIEGFELAPTYPSARQIHLD